MFLAIYDGCLSTSTLQMELRMDRRCSLCRRTKPISQFYKSKNHSLGISNNCKVCDKAYSKEYYQKNKPTILKRMKKWFEVNRLKWNTYVRTWSTKNPQSVARTRKKYRLSHRDKINSYQRRKYWERKQQNG